MSVPGVLAVHDLRAECIGPDVVHASMLTEVGAATSVENAERISQDVLSRVHAGSDMGFCFIHVDPAHGQSGEKNV